MCDIALPPKMVANFAQSARHRIFKGGRGSAKTRSCATMTGVKGMVMAEAGRRGVILCTREHLNSLKDSSFAEIAAAIRANPMLNDYYEIGESYIRTKNRRIEYTFAGLRHNLDSIKSTSRILLHWGDEFEGVTEAAMRKLLPTIREEGSENWISYNPESPDAAVHKRFIEGDEENCIVTEMNWRDNPWFNSALNAERLSDKRNRPDTYEHVWEGGFLTITEAQIFKGKFEVRGFTPGVRWDGPYHGVDFGFAQDPTTAVKCWIYDDCLWIEKEAGKVGLDIDETSQFINDRIPGFEKHTSRADSARPETISYMKRHGTPRIQGVKKWSGSVEDGIAFMRSFDKIIIHEQCPSTAREFRVYSYKVDRHSGDVLPVVVDANNHYIDAIRYALAPMIQAKGAPRLRRL